MEQKIKALINRLKEHLINMYGKDVKKIIVYGSYARGEPTKDSDIDILVLIDESLIPAEVRESLSDLLFDILLDEGEMFSVIVIPESFFESYNSPFILNVKKEGLVA